MMIDPTALRDVFDRAASLPLQERAPFLARACEGNERLRREVERLLAADARLGSTLDTEPGSDPATGTNAGATSLQPGTRLGPYESSPRSAPAAWAKSTKPAIPASVALLQ